MLDVEYKPEDYPDENLIKGVFFKSENDIQTNYLIELCDGKFKGNAIVKIHSVDVLSNHFNSDGITNGSSIGMIDAELLCEVSLSGKYFFPTFNNDMQLYYDEEKYYSGKYKSNSITSLFEAINYAIEYGLKTSNIKPY